MPTTWLCDEPHVPTRLKTAALNDLGFKRVSIVQGEKHPFNPQTPWEIGSRAAFDSVFVKHMNDEYDLDSVADINWSNNEKYLVPAFTTQLSATKKQVLMSRDIADRVSKYGPFGYDSEPLDRIELFRRIVRDGQKSTIVVASFYGYFYCSSFRFSTMKGTASLLFISVPVKGNSGVLSTDGDGLDTLMSKAPAANGYIHDVNLYVHKSRVGYLDQANLPYSSSGSNTEYVTVFDSSNSASIVPINWFTPAFNIVKNKSQSLHQMNLWACNTFKYVCRQLAHFDSVQLWGGNYPLLYPTMCGARTMLLADSMTTPDRYNPMYKIFLLVDFILCAGEVPESLLAICDSLGNTSSDIIFLNIDMLVPDSIIQDVLVYVKNNPFYLPDTFRSMVDRYYAGLVRAERLFRFSKNR
jgi:hypothetical protein